MKAFFTLIFFSIVCSFTSYSQVELWGKTAGGPADEEAESLVVDASGNVYVAGFFKSSLFVLGDKTLKNKGGDASDVFFGEV